VTDLAQLKEAVRRYRELSKDRPNESKGEYAIRLFKRTSAASDIDDALLDPSPISVEALKGMGFKKHPERPSSEWLWIIIGNVKLTWSGPFDEGESQHVMQHFPIESDGFIDSRRGSYVVPFPRTVGQLRFLLLSLSEKESS
jgi:hypothetical protein